MMRSIIATRSGQRDAAVGALKTALDQAGVKNPSIVWLQDGIDHKSDAAEVAKKLSELAGSGTFAVLDEAKGHEALGLAAHLGEKGKLEATVLSPGGPARAGSVYAYSARSERLGEAPFKLAAGERSTTVVFDLPLELRNQVARLEIMLVQPGNQRLALLFVIRHLHTNKNMRAFGVEIAVIKLGNRATA